MSKLLLILLLFCLNANAAFFEAWDRNAYDWRLQIVANSGTISDSSYLTGVRFCLQTKMWGVWDSLRWVNLYLGNNTNAMLQPIINRAGGGTITNDDLVAFVSTDYTEATGLTGNLISKYLRPGGGTGLALSSFGQFTNIHMSLYVRTGSNEATTSMGVGAAGGTFAVAASHTGNTYTFMGLNVVNVADSLGKGHYVMTRTASNRSAVYKNGVAILTDNTADAGSLVSGITVVHAFNSAGTVVSFTARTLSYYGMGTGISAALAVPYRVAVRNVQVATSNRNVE